VLGCLRGDGISNADSCLPAAPYCGEESPREFQTCQMSVIQASKQASRLQSYYRLPSAATITVAFTVQPAGNFCWGQATGKHEANALASPDDVPPRQGALKELTRGNSFEVMHRQPATSSIPVWLVIRWLAVFTRGNWRRGIIQGGAHC
jgi:hypothetical protein